ncbi:MAG: transcriptional regulator [Alcanivorax sp.]|nr:transcriptional regulator [Alcanivorax sp.]UWN48399.1 hypothetical protein ASALC70_00579 [Alcanivorax sp. ALC70]
MNIGAGLKRQRLAQGATLQQVAERAGTDAGNLSRVERNAQDVSFRRLCRLCSALGVRVVDFLRQVEQWDGIETPPPEGDGASRRLRSMVRLFGEVPRRDQVLLIGLARSMHQQNADARRKRPPER